MSDAYIVEQVYTFTVTLFQFVGPVLIAAGLAGLAIAIVQAVTQIQDQSLPSIVKLSLISAMLFVGGAGLVGPFVVQTETVFETFHMQVR